ncbi:MAG: DNA-binding transcriptional regulator [Pirellulales bacterium]
MARIPHIALLIETSREYARGLLRGVARYHHENGPWSIYFVPHGLDEPPPTWLKHWQGDGILCRINSTRMARAVLATGIPAVDVRGALSESGVPFVGLDNRPIARLAYDHLLQCGLKNFAFCGRPRGENPPQDLRCDYFVGLVEQGGQRCEVFTGVGHRGGKRSWEQEQEEIARWLKKLPKPVGIMAANDDRGRQVLDACRRAGLSVPHEVAVLGVDNDTNLCSLCTPPLSSIETNAGLVGYEAAALLIRMMHGSKVPQEPVLIGSPRGLVRRQSTDILAIEDVEVAKALRYIRENACRGIQVRDVLAQTKHSPSTLERRVKALFGRSVKSEITRVRLETAKLLLQETNLRVAQIASRTGFNEAKYFCEVFRSVEGVTPTTFRKRFVVARSD